MTEEMKFKKLIAQYCETAAEDITDDMRFREDLGFTSLGFMSLLGELEDTYDVELDEEDALQVVTVSEAFEMLQKLQQ